MPKVHRRLSGFEYVPLSPGNKNLGDSETGVRIDFFVSGQYPGDGKPKPVAFPDPASVAVRIEDICYVGLAKLIELKLTSGLLSCGRIKDLADVQELIRAARPPRALGDELDASVRDTYFEFSDEISALPEE